MGIFDIAQNAVNQSAGIITGELTLGNAEMMAAIEAQLNTMGIGELLGLFLEMQIVGLCMSIMAIVIFIVVVGRMIEIYLVVSIAPIPLSTMANREWGQMGNNYLKSLFALAFQGFLIMVCVGITAADYDGDYGNYIVINDGNGLEMKYAHCDTLLFAVGQTVTKGDIIATVGNTGTSSTGAHLHMEIVKDGFYINPIYFVE